MKKLLSVMMVFILVSTHLAMADPASAGKKTDSSITVSINGETLSEKGIVKNGRTFLPVAVIGKKLSLPIEWNQSTKTAVIKGNSTIEVKIGSKQAKINGEAVALDIPAFVHSGRTMLPVAFIAKHLGLGINYDAKAKVVAIDARQSNQQPPQPQDQTNPEPQQPSQPELQDPSQPPADDRQFVLEPLPELYPATEYNDRAPGLELYPGLSIDVPYEEMARYGFYHGNIKKLDFKSPEARNILTLRIFMENYVLLAELEPNSNPLNIPLNIRENSTDGILWKKVAKTGVFQFLINPNGKVNMDRALTWPEVCHILVKHFEWMGVDPYGYENFAPLHSFDLNGYNGPYVSDVYAIVNVGYYVPFTEGGMNNRKLRDNIANKKIAMWEWYFILEDASGRKLIKH